ncbi:secreted alpha beta hydrolase family protein [Cryptosporidium ryanae]|uniref:secreted alpha beta hydrolase family protein n=1 Tax=Cryptosporidium ryanae TaxID=515981 RepID=UPI00351A2105|nr:secreted alpha beta hydrolase family protein [Cryptosporidium ryanae]
MKNGGIRCVFNIFIGTLLLTPHPGVKWQKDDLFVASIPLKKSDELSVKQCQDVVEKLESTTLGFLFSKKNICKPSTTSNRSWQRRLIKSAYPPYLEFHNEIYPSKTNIEMESLARRNRSAMLESMGSGSDYSKCFILGYAGYGNRGMWSASVAKGLASQFYDNKVPLRWDVVAGISSGAFNAVMSSHFVPGGKTATEMSRETNQGNSGNTSDKAFKNEFIFNNTDSRSDSYICSSIGKEVKFEFWIKFGSSKKNNNVKCYSPTAGELDLENIYFISNNSKIENELSYTNFLYEVYLRGNSEVVNDNCYIPTSQDSTRWWSTILLTFANFGKKPISNFCTLNGWKKFYRDSMLRYMTIKREAIVSASRLFDGTLINWSIQYILAQIKGNKNSNKDESFYEWVEINENDASRIADIATASNAVSGAYLPVKVNNEYYIWGGLRGESNLESAVERCKELKPGIDEENIVIDFITGSYFREEIFLSGSYVNVLGKESYFGKLFRRFENYIHSTNAYARPNPPQLFELFNRAWEFITSSSRGLFPVKSLIRKYPKVKIRFFIRPKTLKFFPKSSYIFPNHKDKLLIMTDGYYTGYNATIVDVNFIETYNSV